MANNASTVASSAGSLEPSEMSKQEMSLVLTRESCQRISRPKPFRLLLTDCAESEDGQICFALVPSEIATALSQAAE